MLDSDEHWGEASFPFDGVAVPVLLQMCSCDGRFSMNVLMGGVLAPSMVGSLPEFIARIILGFEVGPASSASIMALGGLHWLYPSATSFWLIVPSLANSGGHGI